MRIVLAARAFVTLAIGIYITFNQSHSAEAGLIALGLFGVGYAVANAASSFFFAKRLTAIETVPMTVIALLIGVFAFLVSANSSVTHKASLTALVTAWGLVSAAFELYLARRQGFKTQLGRDTLLSAILNFLLAILFLTVPLKSVELVGFFGAYLVLSGVHVGITAATPKAKPKSRG